MSAPLRFLGLILVDWAGVRAATLGIIPGGELFRFTRSDAAPAPAIQPTEFPTIDPVGADLMAASAPAPQRT